MKDTKQVVLIALFSFLFGMFLVMFITLTANQTYQDGIKAAETHHLIKHKYFNEYVLIDSTRQIVEITKEADFNKTFWEWNVEYYEK